MDAGTRTTKKAGRPVGARRSVSYNADLENAGSRSADPRSVTPSRNRSIARQCDSTALSVAPAGGSTAPRRVSPAGNTPVFRAESKIERVAARIPTRAERDVPPNEIRRQSRQPRARRRLSTAARYVTTAAQGLARSS